MDFKKMVENVPNTPRSFSSFNSNAARQLAALQYGGPNKSRTLAHMVD